MEKVLEYLKFIGEKNYMSLGIFIVVTAVIVWSITGYIIPHTQNIVDLRKGNVEKRSELEKKEAQLKTQQKEKQMKEHKKAEKVPVAIYKPEKPNTPLENSVVDLVTSVIQKLERADLSIADISYKSGSLKSAAIPAGVDTIEIKMTLNGSYIAFQEFLYELYDDKYLSLVKSVKMSPMKENKTLLEIDTTIQLFVER